jgi:flagellar biosynthesis anti-sigma factor FlgM
MNIPPEFRPVDPAVRRRQGEPAGKSASKDVAHASPSAAKSAGVSDTLTKSGFDHANVSQFVAILKDMNPLDLHKVEDLRQRIADGSYSTDPDELADLLLGGEERKPRHGHPA